MRNLVLLYLCLFTGSSIFAIDNYPVWFIYPRLYPDVVIGFSYNGNSPDMDAEVMHCVYNGCEVRGFLETIQINDSRYLKNTKYYYVYPIEKLEKIRGCLNVLDGFCSNVFMEELITAYAEKKIGIDTTLVNINEIKKPNWAEESTWESTKYYYGVGVFTSHGNENDAWKTSEEQAIYSILTAQAVTVYSVSRTDILSVNESYQEESLNYLRFNVEFSIGNIQTLERWIDIENDCFYTLVRIPTENLTFNN